MTRTSNSKEFKRLEQENDKIRVKIVNLLERPEEELKEKMFKLIGELIENEIELEKYCDN